ncbi:MAG: hypothetical protein LBE83_00800, partial [Propionibacteriaceae bacterium]|nr:hypothetical protein [Propionibacteriaceae bacterium]
MTAIAQWPRLLAHILKRDRISLPVWILAVVSFCAGFVPAMPAIIGTNAEMAVMGEMMANPAMIAMCGIFPNVPFTIAIFYTQMMLVWSALLVAAMNILIVIRHTRADEDEGRSEVIRALPVGRGANLMAVIVLMIAVNVIMAILIGVSMPAFGIESVDLAGSLVYGAALGACGLFFAGLTVVVAQVMDNARSVTGLALGLMGGFYLLRAYGDVSSETAAWLSPFGAIQRTYPYSANDWWPAVGLAGLGVILM